MPPTPVRILSWNVNGLRSCAGKGFARVLARSRAEIVGVQEVRARPEQLPAALREPRRWHAAFSAAERAGYSGVALFARRPPDRVDTALGVPEFDREGRLQLARFGRLVIANVYFPKGSGRERDNSRVPYKLAFYRALFEELEKLRRSGRRVLVMGDFNTAHREIDLARPRDNRDQSGFLPEERAELDAGWRAAGSTPSGASIRRRSATPGGASASGCAPAMSAGESTTCWPRRPRCASCAAASCSRT
jgi:exodeoxyribonuclease-3